MGKAASKQKNVGGRPTWYRPEYADEAYRLSLLGATEADLARAFDVDERTIQRWKASKLEFRRSIARGGMTADGNVAQGLYQRAVGYSHPAVKIFAPTADREAVKVEYTEHYPPDTAAASLWLRNRRPGQWREKTDVGVTGVISLEALVLDSLGAARQIEGEARVIEDKGEGEG